MQRESIIKLGEALRKRAISSVELTQLFLERIRQYDEYLNSFITVSEELALAQARQADRLFNDHKINTPPLTGIPIAHKDLFCTAGVRTTCGSKMLGNFVSPYDATIVEKLGRAGTVMLGKTNMDEFAMGSSNENSHYGPAKNPWCPKAVPGGSSGGSAVAVAAALTPVATGTDTGGSIRQPAAFCGLTGIKPTYGRVSRYGLVAFASSLDQAGVLSKSAEDAAALLQAMSGFDDKDSTSAEEPVADYSNLLDRSISGLIVGIPDEYFSAGVSPKTAASVEEAIRHLEKAGAKTKRVNLPTSSLAVSTYYIIAPAECSSNLARYDGVRYGYRATSPRDLEDMYVRSRSEGFGPEVKRRIMIGTYVLSAGYYDAYYLKAQKIRRLISEDFQRVFREVDVIAGPTTPEPAFELGTKVNDPVSMYLSDVFTTAINLAGLPAISLPVGFDGKLPIGMQLIGNHFSESTLLSTAHQFQLSTDWHCQYSSEFE